jgi:hypothetical protein
MLSGFHRDLKLHRGSNTERREQIDGADLIADGRNLYSKGLSAHLIKKIKKAESN